MSFLVVMKLLILASVVLNVAAMAMHSRPRDVLHLFRHWQLGVGAFVAMFVVVPAIALALMLNFGLKPEVKTALLVLALSPVPPLLPRRQAKAGAESPYITGLLAAAALVSLVVMPLGLQLAGVLFGIDLEVSTTGVAMTLLATIAAPMLLGFLARNRLGPRAPAVSLVLRKAGMLLALDGLRPPSDGASVSFTGGEVKVTDGPFAEAKEVVGGYWIIQARSTEEAIEWAKRCPGENCRIEVRPIFEIPTPPPVP